MNLFLKLILVLMIIPSFAQEQNNKSLIFSLKSGKPFQSEITKELGVDSDYVPTVEVFLPEKTKSTGKGILIFPGGGYGMVAYQHEGTSWASFFNEQGIAVFVVKYSLPKGDRNRTLTDVTSAMNIIKNKASEWKLNLDDIGVMGFSAGGHLASVVATRFEKPIKPAFQILFYPVITMDASYTHIGSRNNFLGKNPSETLVNEFSNEKQVTERTPPALIIVATDDQIVPVENSLNYFKSLKNKNIPVSLHIYPTGNHGWGYSKDYKHNQVILEELKSWIGNYKQ